MPFSSQWRMLMTKGRCGWVCIASYLCTPYWINNLKWCDLSRGFVAFDSLSPLSSRAWIDLLKHRGQSDLLNAVATEKRGQITRSKNLHLNLYVLSLLYENLLLIPRSTSAAALQKHKLHGSINTSKADKTSIPYVHRSIETA